MHIIHCKKIVLRILLACCVFFASFQAHSQVIKQRNLPLFDQRKMHYGFILGINHSGFKVKHSQYFFDNRDTLLSLTPYSNTGFTLGFVFNLHLGDFFDFRVLPSVGFYQRNLNYTLSGGTMADVQVIESSFIELPLIFKYKAIRRLNSRPYVLLGIKPSISTGSKRKDQRPDQLRINNYDLAIEYGFGWDFYFQMFKFSTELRFSHGIANMLSADDNIYARSINRLTTHTVTLFFNFE